MLKVPPVALAAALLGREAAHAQAALPGCYPAYSSSASYVKGSIVSANKEVETSTIVECDPDAADCPSTGKRTVLTTKDEPHNFECHTEVWCNNEGFRPDGIYGDLAWEDPKPCEGKAVIAAAEAPEAWDGGGCPARYSDGGDYGAGDAVSFCPDGQGWCTVYQCKGDELLSLWCAQAAYAPGASLYWEQAWDELGSCVGTLTPTSSPSFDPEKVVGGCPSEYEAGTTYEAGARVSKDRFVFECKEWPRALWCGLPGFEPLVDSATPNAWKEAWDMAGYCEGTAVPTASPVFVTLEDLGGCPAEWKVGTGGLGYDEGDRVSANGLVFECKGWPFSVHCAQAGYEPLEDPATPDAWKDAWTIIGHCSGTLAPNAANDIAAAAEVFEGPDLGLCPRRAHALGQEYDSGELVKVCALGAESCCAVYKCAADSPNPSGWCGLSEAYVPGEGWAWQNAWSLEGFCCPTESPTKSPTESPTKSPTKNPSEPPTKNPTKSPIGCPAVYPVLDFEGLTTSNFASIPAGYGGFTWSSLMYLINKSYHPDSGYDFGSVSGDYAAFTTSGSISSATPFSVHGFVATAAWNVGLVLDVTSYDASNNLVGTYQITLPHPDPNQGGGPTCIDLSGGDFDDIYELRINTSGGTSAGLPAYGGGIGSGGHVAIDDMQILA